MKLSPDQCAVLAQVIPTLLIALIAERYFGVGDEKVPRLFLIGVGVATVAVPGAVVVCVAGVDSGASGAEVLYVVVALGWLLIMVAVGTLRAAIELPPRPRDVDGDHQEAN